MLLFPDRDCGKRGGDGSRIVTGVSLVRGLEDGPPHYRIKEMSENEGPVASFASERILDLLTEPVTDQAAGVEASLPDRRPTPGFIGASGPPLIG